MVAKFFRIASEGSRRNFRSFNFRGARMHGEARRYRYGASGNFHFHGSQPFCENREILHHAKISHYMVYTVCVCLIGVRCGNLHIDIFPPRSSSVPDRLPLRSCSLMK